MITRNIVLEVDGLKIVGQLYLPGTRTPYPAVCICHGIPGGAPDPGDGGYPLLAEKICREGFGVFIFNFRGTGTSGGNLDMVGWTRDLTAVIDHLCSLPELDRSFLSLVGFSGGAAVSVFVASQDSRVSSVIACACPAEFKFADPLPIIQRFRDIKVIRDEDFPASVAEWASGFRQIRPVRYVAGIAPRPLLLVHGNQDETVPVSDAHNLYRLAKEPRQIIIVDGAGHRLRQNEEVVTIITDGLKHWYYNSS